MKDVIEQRIHACRLAGTEVSQEPVHALERRLDIAVAIAECKVKALVGVGVPETEMTIVLRCMEGAGRQAERQCGQAFEEQAALGDCVISEESGHE